MTNKERYKSLCERHELPLFLQYWWMETVCAGKDWDVCLVFGQKGGKKFSLEEKEGDVVVGAMPYLIRKRMGFRFVLQPQLTQYNGPWYNYALLPEGCSESQRLDFEKKVADKILLHMQRLKLHYFEQQFSPSITNWLPYHWWGYRQTTRYTYRIEDLSDLDAVFAGFDRNERQKKILRLQPQYETTLSLSPEDFADLHVRHMKSRGKKDLVPREFIIRLCSEAIAHHSGIILALRPVGEETVVAARFVVWDRSQASSLLSCLNPDTYRNGLTELLVWKAIQYVAPLTQTYDFEGSMDINIEHYYRLFGATQMPFHRISKSNSRLFQWILDRKLAHDRKELTRQVKAHYRQNPRPKKKRKHKSKR